MSIFFLYDIFFNNFSNFLKNLSMMPFSLMSKIMEKYRNREKNPETLTESQAIIFATQKQRFFFSATSYRNKDLLLIGLMGVPFPLDPVVRHVYQSLSLGTGH